MEGTLISELKKKKLKQIKIQQRVTAGVIALLGIAFSFWKSYPETAILVTLTRHSRNQTGITLKSLTLP